MSTNLVSSQAEFLSALKAAKGGDTILLADGDYGALRLDTKFAKNLKVYDTPVTIKAVNPGEAHFDSLELRYAKNLDFDGIGVDGTMKVWYNSSDIGVRNSDLGTLHLRTATNVEVVNNDIGGGQMGLVVLNTSDVTVENNHLHGVYEDMMRVIGNSGNVTIENNYFDDPVPAKGKHSDNIQMWSEGGKTPHDITIRGNIFHDDPSTGATSSQGVFMAKPSATGYDNILIEQNLMSVEQPNTIFINSGSGGSNVVIRDNSLVTGKGDLGAKIQLTGNASHAVTVEGNVAVGYRDVAGQAEIGDNHFFGTGQHFYPSNDQSDIYQSPDYIGWKSFLPVDGSAIGFGSGYGAQARLKELMAGVDNDFGVTRLAYEANDGSAAARVAAVDGSLALKEATVSLSFTAAAVGGSRTIVSKDGTGLDNGFSAEIKNGTLVVSFEDADGVQTISQAGVTAGAAHDLTVSFEDGLGRAWLDGAQIGSVETSMDWSKSSTGLVTGSGTTVSDLRVYDEGMTHREVSGYNAARSEMLALLESDADSSQTALYAGGIKTFTNKTAGTVVVDGGDDLALSQGTVVVNFSPDIVYGGRGIVAKDSAGLGNGFYASISNGTLKLSFEDDAGVQTISHAGIARYGDYQLVTNFGDGEAKAWLNGDLIGTVKTDMDWTDSHDQLVLGATTAGAAEGTTSQLKNPYDGIINGLLVLNESMSASEVAAYVDAHPSLVI